ncbi:hypothetical protein NSQ82_16495 [Caldifermentibacillus hisashii]|uniref:hypothetical protein n=1 Tax=Caldifermentibacillus hisashii TaxID=996558 RepID=UPI0031B7163C
MTVLELVNILKATGYPVAYSHFESTETNPAPDPPFICYVIPDTDNFKADNKVYHKISNVDIELYTDYKDFEAEQKLEDLLELYEIPWDSYETYIESEKMYQKLYEVRLI